jgi:hypothetical protein
MQLLAVPVAIIFCVCTWPRESQVVLSSHFSSVTILTPLEHQSDNTVYKLIIISDNNLLFLGLSVHL